MGLARKPNFRMRQLGRLLRRLREQAGYTQDDAGAKLRFSKSKMSRIEQGKLGNYHEFLAMLDLYGVIVSDFEEYVRVFDRAQEHGWWRAYGMDDRGFVSIEAEASVIRNYEIGFVPGLLQTEDYMRKAFASDRVPLGGKSLENQIIVRLRRQSRLTGEPLLKLHAIVDETVFGRPGCDRAQLDHIVDRAELPNVSFQIVPRCTALHNGLYSNFLVVSFGEPEEPDLGYVEYGFGALEIEDVAEVRAARLTFGHLAELALDEGQSLALIKEMATNI